MERRTILTIILLFFLSAGAFAAGFYFDSFGGSDGTLLDTAWRLQSEGRFEAALFFFEEYLKSNPGSAYAYSGLAWSQFELGRMDEAREHFEHALQLDPDQESAHRGLAFVNLYRKGFPEAIQEFDAAIAIDPNVPNAYSGKGWAYYVQNEFELAVESFNQFFAVKEPRDIATDISQGDAYYGLALSYLALGENEAAKEPLNRARKLWEPSVNYEHINRRFADIEISLIQADYLTSGFSSVEQDIEHLLDTYPNECKVYWLVGWIYFNEEQYEKSTYYLNISSEENNCDYMTRPWIDSSTSMELLHQIELLQSTA